jgi:hypothetical protein
VSEKKVPRKLFAHKKEKIKRSLRKVHNEKIHYVNSSPNIIRVIKSRRMRWRDMWHVWSRRGMHGGLWRGILKEGERLE